MEVHAALRPQWGARLSAFSYGGGIPNSVKPWGNQRFTARFAVPCAPCYSFTFCPKENNRCVTGITSESVLKLLDNALLEKANESL